MKIRTLQVAKELAREAAAYKAHLRKHGQDRNSPRPIRASKRPMGRPVVLSSEYAIEWVRERFCG